MTMRIDWYLKRVIAILFLLVILYSVYLWKESQTALFIHICQPIAPLFASFRLFCSDSKKINISAKAKNLFGTALVLIAVSDICYCLLLSIWKLPTSNVFIRNVTTLPYYAAYMFAAWGMLTISSGYKSKLSKTVWIFPIVTLFLSIPFVVLPSIHLLKLSDPFAFVQMIAIPISLMIINLSFFMLLTTREMNWSIFFAGWFAFGITDWAIQVETLTRTSYVPSTNGYLWTFSGLLTCLPLLRKSIYFDLFESFENSSLTTNIRIQSISILAIPLAFLGYALKSNWYGMLTISFGFVFGVVGILFITQYIVDRLKILGNILHRLSDEDFYGLNASEISIQIPTELRNQVLKVIGQRITFEKEKSQKMLDAASARNRLASQLSHDIRSPLAALKAVKDISSKNLSTEQIKLLTNSIDRITDIANTVLPKDNDSQIAISQSCFIWALVDQLISEKRVQYKNFENLTIDFYYEGNVFSLNAVCNQSEFMRALSNIIDNAIDAKALGRSAKILVKIVEHSDVLKLLITDNGIGIPKKYLSKVMEEGFTRGKNHGSGLGLFQAETSVKLWGGEIKIESEEGKGTSIEIELCKSRCPPWLVDNLQVEHQDEIVLLDDEEYVFQIIQEKFKSYGKPMKYFRSIDDLKIHVKSAEGKKVVYFIDHDLKQEIRGLDLIHELKIEEYAILLTGHYDDYQTQQNSTEFGIKILPKPLIHEVQVTS